MATSGRLTERQSAAWRAYIEGSLRLETRLDDELRAASGLSLIDYHVLVLLNEAPQRRLRMSELADQLVFSRSRITYQVNSMSRRGLVAREPVPDDRRGYRAVLTATGLETLRAAAPHHARSVQRLFLSAVADRDLPTITRVFSRMRNALKPS